MFFIIIKFKKSERNACDFHWLSLNHCIIRYDTRIAPPYRTDSHDSLIVRYNIMVRIVADKTRTVSYDSYHES
jgi:hypothetical protein